MGIEGGAKRPGGLTALAVLNFIFGGLGLLGVLGLLAWIKIAESNDPKFKEQIAKLPGAEFLYFFIVLGLVGAVLLILSGVGYLQQKRFLGKTLGITYGIFELANVGLQLAMWPDNFGIQVLIGLVYPVLTLFLLLTVFKDDFPNP